MGTTVQANVCTKQDTFAFKYFQSVIYLMTAYVCCASFVCLLSLILVTSARPKIAAYNYHLANLIKGICLKENILEPAFQHNSEFYCIVVAHGRLCPDILERGLVVTQTMTLTWICVIVPSINNIQPNKLTVSI